MLSFSLITRFVVIAICVVLVTPNSRALLLGSFIGCNSFGCRLTSLENDVAQLKQQVARFSDPHGHMVPNSNARPSGMLQQFGGQNGVNPQGQNQQQQGGQQEGGSSGQQVRYALDFPVNQQTLRRNPSYPTVNQFMGA